MSSILDIQTVKANQYAFYYFDANCWITQLLVSTPEILRPQPEKYTRFFSDMIVAGTPKPITVLAKPGTYTPKIVVTSLLVSEIFNTYMRIRWEHFKKSAPSCTTFKRHYRPTSDYEKNLKNLVSDFQAYRDYTVLESDYVHEIDPYTLLQEVSARNDFNDMYSYFQIMEIQKVKKPIAIVTDDADFAFHSVDVITANRNLLSFTKKPGKKGA